MKRRNFLVGGFGHFPANEHFLKCQEVGSFGRFLANEHILTCQEKLEDERALLALLPFLLLQDDFLWLTALQKHCIFLKMKRSADSEPIDFVFSDGGRFFWIWEMSLPETRILHFHRPPQDFESYMGLRVS